MKNYFRALMIVFAAVVLFLFCGCNSNDTDDEKIKVVATNFAVYEWTKNVTAGCDNVSLTYLLDKGEEMHSFQASAGDIVTISSADLVVCVGGESEEWLSDIVDKDSFGGKVLKLIEDSNVTTSLEELKEGMEGEAEEGAVDEHIWLSVNNAEASVKSICNYLCELDSFNTSAYCANRDVYLEKLSEIETFDGENNVLIFGDRFPFIYLLDELDCDYYAPFKGCDTDCDASFKTIAFMAEKLENSESNIIFVLEGSDNSVAEAIIKASGRSDVEIVTLNSMQQISTEDIQNGASYIDIMNKNIENIKRAV